MEVANAIFKCFDRTGKENRTHVHRLQSGPANHDSTAPNVTSRALLVTSNPKYCIDVQIANKRQFFNYFTTVQYRQDTKF